VRVREVPDDLFPKGAFSKLEDVLDRPVISPILTDEPVMGTRLATRGAGLGLAPMIPDGMRAIAVRVNDVVGVAGFILPGMHVDVLSTGRAPRRDDVVTRTVLEDITVLSVGQTIQVEAKSQAISAVVVTLLVDPEQAEALTLANSEGHIQLVLRNSTDRKPGHPPGWQSHKLFAADTPDEQPQPAPPPRATRPAPEARPEIPRTRTLTVSEGAPTVAPVQMLVIRGSKKTVEQFPAQRVNP